MRTSTGSIRVTAGAPVGLMLVNSTIMALAIALGKISISLLSAYAPVGDGGGVVRRADQREVDREDHDPDPEAEHEVRDRALTESGMAGAPVGLMLVNSTIMALAIALGKISPAGRSRARASRARAASGRWRWWRRRASSRSARGVRHRNSRNHPPGSGPLVENRRFGNLIPHLVLCLGALPRRLSIAAKPA
jgi:hypothetical protein